MLIILKLLAYSLIAYVAHIQQWFRWFRQVED